MKYTGKELKGMAIKVMRAEKTNPKKFREFFHVLSFLTGFDEDMLIELTKVMRGGLT